jgi:hypothetical protein
VEKNNSSSTNAQFSVLFGPTVLGRLPTDGQERVRLTMLYVIGKSYINKPSWIKPDLAIRRVFFVVHYVTAG